MARNEDALITCGDAAQAGAQIHHRSNECKRWAVGVEAHIEAPPDRSASHLLANAGPCPVWQSAVRMQKQHDVAVSDASTGVHLRRPATLGKHHLRTGTLRTVHRVVRAATIDDNACIAVRPSGMDRVGDGMRLIEHRHHDGQTEVGRGRT